MPCRLSWRTWIGVRLFVTDRALEQLKFAELLPLELARRTMEERLSNPAAAAAVLNRPIPTANGE
jgi:hypothetical protein